MYVTLMYSYVTRMYPYASVFHVCTRAFPQFLAPAE